MLKVVLRFIGGDQRLDQTCEFLDLSFQVFELGFLSFFPFLGGKSANIVIRIPIYDGLGITIPHECGIILDDVSLRFGHGIRLLQ